MAYYFYLDKLLLPVAPGKLTLKINNQNETMNMINEGEINLLRRAGLTDVEFEVSIPQQKYPHAYYPKGFKRASHFLNKFEELKTQLEPFQFIVTRSLPSGDLLFDTNLKVSMEEYEIIEDESEGTDLLVSIRLKQYQEYGTKKANIKFSQKKPSVTVKKPRPKTPKKVGIGSNVIVNGRLHRDSYGKGPGQTRTNYRGKINFINMKGSHPYHITTPSGAWQGWVTASSVKGV